MTKNNDQIKSLAELNDALENYFANTIIPQLFIDSDLVLRKFTPPAMKQFDLKDEFIGLHIDQIKDNFRYPTVIDNINVVLATGKILEKEIQTTDKRWYQMNILPYHVRKESRTDGVIITFIDITSRIKELKDQQELVADHELLLDTIAHDIKNPILGLSLSVQMLKKDPRHSLDKYPSLLENIEVGLANIKDVISDLIDSRWKEQKRQAAEELVDLENILEDVRLTLASQIEESKATIKHQIEASEILFVRRKLRSVVYNLLNNAIKYTPADRPPDILIKSYIENDYTVICVIDNGIGISEQEQHSIFEKFKRVESEYEGSGVGLYLVNTIITNAGGRIALESLPGKGSVFKVLLPNQDI